MTINATPRPTAGDVVELILEDHRVMEALLRELRDVTADRSAARKALADLLVAHGEAEESEVYPRLHSREAITEHEKEHGEEEHAEGNAALLALLEVQSTEGAEFDEAVEALAEALNHHIGEEEQAILNPARTSVSQQTRDELGAAWAVVRNRLLDEHCGSVTRVRQLVRRAEDEGLLGEGG